MWAVFSRLRCKASIFLKSKIFNGNFIGKFFQLTSAFTEQEIALGCTSEYKLLVANWRDEDVCVAGAAGIDVDAWAGCDSAIPVGLAHCLAWLAAGLTIAAVICHFWGFFEFDVEDRKLRVK